METIINEEVEDNSEEIVDPLDDILDYLVRSARISFKNSHVDEAEIRMKDKVCMAKELFIQSPTEFLIQFGKFLAPYHVDYFEKISVSHKAYQDCIDELKVYHSDAARTKRVRNRRYKALQQLQDDSDYFSEKQMMLRNPLLYEQLIGQYLTDDEVRERDGVDNENLNLLSMILDTVDRNHMTEMKNKQMLEEGLESVSLTSEDKTEKQAKAKKKWGDFDTPDTTPSFKPEVRKQSMTSAPERRMLREEFYQEMYSSFIEGRDDFDYDSVDTNELFDDLQQVSQDAEDRYFDSETNEVDNLEEHMKLVEEYGRRNSSNSTGDTDSLDVFMECISNKLKN